MNSTVVVAAFGFASTLIGSWLAAHLQRRSASVGRIKDAQVRVYGDCVANLYEYERATYNRVKARLASRSEAERDELRQAAYRTNTEAQSTIGQAALLSGSQTFRTKLEEARKAIGDLNKATNESDLRQRRELIHGAIGDALSIARSDLLR